MMDANTDKPNVMANFQRPGIPGAGNILDPAVRGEIREQVQAAVHGAISSLMEQILQAHQARSKDTQAPFDQSQGPETPAPPPAASRPNPHGDMDLSFIAGNVPPRPVKPRRSKAERRYYFLDQPEPTAEKPAEFHPVGPKPG